MPFHSSSIHVRRVVILTLLAAGAGCATRVIPPPHPADPVPVFIANYGRHSSIVLPDNQGGSTEYAFGDWEWFALSHTTFGDGFRALFNSHESALGRRKLRGPTSRPVIADQLNITQVAQLTAARARVDALVSELDARFRRHAETRVYNHDCQMWFVKDDEHYRLFNNCNHLTARWLEALACKIEGSAFTAEFRVVGDHTPSAPHPDRQ